MEQKRTYQSKLATVVFFSISLLVLIIFRMVYSTPIEIDGDSVGKWFSAEMFARAGQWEDVINGHHQLRWAIMIPQAIVSKMIPGRYESYFVLPILVYSAFSILCMAILLEAQQKKTWAPAILLGVFLCADPISHVMASQLKTVAFGLFYFAFGVTVFLRYLKDKGTWWLVLSATAFFFAYGAHVTYVIFAVAPVLVLVVNLRQYRGTLVFIGTFAILVCGELLLTGGLLGVAEGGGRLAHIISGVTHEPVLKARGGGSERGLQYWDLISRWRLVPKFELMVFLGYLVGSMSLFWGRIRQSVPISMWMFFYAAGAYAVAISLPIVDIEPLRLAMALHTRYLAPIFPLSLVFLVWLFSYGCQRLGGFFNQLQIGASAILAIVFISGSNTYSCVEELSPEVYSDNIEEVYCHFFRYSQNQNIYPSPDHFLFGAQKYYDKFRRDYLDGKVSLYGETRIDILGTLIKFGEDSAVFVETPRGWYSIDGSDRDWCVIELGQTEKPEQNYRYCSGRKMNRDIFY